MPSKRIKRVDLRGQSLDGVELFAKYHIIGMRHTKNGYISQVKHVQFGWMSPQQYYRFEKLHDMMPLLQEFIRGGYQAKAWLWSIDVGVLGITVPIGASLPAIEAWNLYAELTRTPINPAMLALRLYALLGPWGDVIQIIDSLILATGVVNSDEFWLTFLAGPILGGTEEGRKLLRAIFWPF